MLAIRDNLNQSVASLRAHRLRTALTVLGLTLGVTTLITVVTLIQGANVYVETKIANLGTNVFQVTRLPTAVTDFNLILKALRHKRLEMDDVRAIVRGCAHCDRVGASSSSNGRAEYRNEEIEDVNIIGHTPSMAEIDTRTVVLGRYFTETENQRSAFVCLIGDTLAGRFFPGLDPIGRSLRIANYEFTVIGTFERIGSLLGQDQDRFAVIPMDTFLRIRGRRQSIIINVQTRDSLAFQKAQDEARLIMRARRHIGPNQEEDFFFTTRDSYIALWQSISAAFFAVFILVSAISAVVGGIVIMNVMLVSVTERTKEIGVRRAVGATQADIMRQFLVESVMQCVAGGVTGIALGFACAVALRNFTEFPAAVQTWVAVMGVALSTAIGLFFGIYPAMRAAQLDPVAALRSE